MGTSTTIPKKNPNLTRVGITIIDDGNRTRFIDAFKKKYPQYELNIHPDCQDLIMVDIPADPSIICSIGQISRETCTTKFIVPGMGLPFQC